jgi:hypothetical protein
MTKSSNNRQNVRPNDSCYMPDTVLVEYIHKRLRYEQAKRAERMSENAAGKAENDTNIKDNGPDSRMYNYVMNKVIFPSMANILYFLEQVSKHGELQEVFDEDIEELLGLKIPPDKIHKGYLPAIYRLLLATVTWNNEKDPTNYRLHVIENMQKICHDRLQNIAYLDGSKGPDMARLIGSDIGRAWTWAQVFASQNKTNYGEANRPILF